jgi:IMP dehydrogenase
MELEIGRGKKARRAYGFDDIAIVPSRRTRDPDDVDVSWTLGPYRFELPLLASRWTASSSPETAGVIGKLGGLAVLNLEGIWTRYEDADASWSGSPGWIAKRPRARWQEIYLEPVKEELIAQRSRDQGARVVARRVAVAAEGRALARDRDGRGPGHPSSCRAPLSRRCSSPARVSCSTSRDSCASCRSRSCSAAAAELPHGPALNAPRARPACSSASVRRGVHHPGVLGIGVPQATAIADVAGARSQHMLETGEYVR